MVAVVADFVNGGTFISRAMVTAPAGIVPPGFQSQGLSPGRIATIGMCVLLVPILMFFLAFASAYIVRHGMGEGWTRVQIPSLLWGNTVALVISSAVLEYARRSRNQMLRKGLWGAFGLGALFLLGQWLVWRQLLAAGIDIGTSPHSSFFYLLTIAHAVHLLGGLLGLLAAAAWPSQGRWKLNPLEATQVAAIYWHFMGALWLGLVLLLALGR